MTHKASIGRLVHYYEGDFEAPNHWPEEKKSAWMGTNGTRWHPAIVTRVWSDQCVNLIVMFDAQGPMVKSSAMLLPYEVFASGVHCTNSGWRWPERV